MNYLSHVPAIIVGVAVIAFGLVLLRDYLKSEPGPIVSYPLIMADRRIRAFNKRLATMTKRHGADHE
jgi:hypothetical protein